MKEVGQNITNTTNIRKKYTDNITNKQGEKQRHAWVQKVTVKDK